MIKKRLLVLIYFLFSLSAYTQISLDKSKQEVDSIFLYYSQNNKLDSLADFAHNLSVKSYRESDYRNAVFYAEESIKASNKTLNNVKSKNTLFNLALFYYLNEEYYKSIKTYKHVIDSFHISKKTYSSFNEIGRNYRKIGDYYQAINYYKKGLAVPDSLSINNLFTHYVNFSLVYNDIETHESLKESLKLLKKADSLHDIYRFKGQRFYSLYNNYGLYYNYKNENTFNFTKSNKYYFYCLEEALKNNDSSTIVSAYNNLSKNYITVRNDSALYFIKKGLSYNSDKHIAAKIHLNLSDYYTNKNEFTKAFVAIQKALQLDLGLPLNNSSYKTVPNFNQTIASKDKFLTITILKEKASCFLNLHNQYSQIENISSALEHLFLADQLFDELKSNSIEVRSKLFWQKEASELYILGVKVSYILNDIDQAFYFIEKNKALLLLENSNENEIRKHANLPIEVLEQEFLFKKKINEIENNLNYNKAQKDSINQKYYTLKIEHHNFIESLKKSYPEYYNSKRTIDITSFKETKDNLNPNILLLEYIINKKEGFLLASTNKESKLYKLDSVTNTLQLVENYLAIISKPFKTQTELDGYKKLSHNLYKQLFPFHENEFEKGINKIIIIPDNILQNLPFETLITEAETTNYLIKTHTISYAYSMSYLKDNKKLNRQAKNNFLGFAPHSFNYDNLQSLPRSQSEIKTIETLITGESFMNLDATKSNFLNTINNYKIIHLSTHANANDSIAPWIAFKDDKLYLNELYTFKNQAELVVLNACKSSLGEINSGEGVFSLARGFFYSGANSVISSLWNVNDKSNQEITISFYKYLKKGKTKSAALRLAKLDYLEKHSLSEASPYYWSSLILIGDDSSMKVANYNWLQMLIISLLILISIIFIKKHKNRG